jgi:hypothetical protein
VGSNLILVPGKARGAFDLEVELWGYESENRRTVLHEAIHMHQLCLVRRFEHTCDLKLGNADIWRAFLGT